MKTIRLGRPSFPEIGKLPTSYRVCRGDSGHFETRAPLTPVET